jgi:hypothetical protein
MPLSIDYAVPGPLTTLAAVDPAALDGVGADPVEICRPVAGLVIQPEDAQALDLAAERFATNQIRQAGELVRHLLALDPAPVTVPRAPERRVVGTCRHFAVLSCALLRHRGRAGPGRTTTSCSTPWLPPATRTTLRSWRRSTSATNCGYPRT